MTRYKGYAQDPETAINASYFVDVAGTNALTIMGFKRRTSFMPPIPLDNPAYMIDNNSYSRAKKGKLVTAELSLECIANEAGEFYCRELDKFFNKVIYLCPKILNPRNIQHFLPNGTNISTPVFNDFLPDREIKIPINLIEISDINDIGVRVLNPVLDQTPPETDHDRTPVPPAPFPIYRDPPMEMETPTDSGPTSPASTMSMSTSDASSLFEAGNVVPGKPLTMILRPRDTPETGDFEPLSTSTKSPEKKSNTVYDDPTPGPSSAPDQGSVTHPLPKRPKTPRKSPRKELKRTASQPAIDDFMRNPPSRNQRLPSPIPRDLNPHGKRPRSPSSPHEENSAKYKRILSDLSAEERDVTRSLEDALMRDDPAIKEATVNPDSIGTARGPPSRTGSRQASAATERSSSSEGSTIPSKSDIFLDDTPQDNVDHVIPFNPDLEVSEDAGNPNRNPTPPPPEFATRSDDLRNSDRDLNHPELQKDVGKSSDESSPLAQGEDAGNALSDPSPPEFLKDAGQSSDDSSPKTQKVFESQVDARNSLRDLPLPTPEPSDEGRNSDEGMDNQLAQSQPIIINVGNAESSQDQVMAFNIINAQIANANLDGAARPRRGPPTPEHVLIEVDRDGNISHLLHFHQPHDPLDIIEAFLNNTLNSSAPDEGFDSTVNTTPAAPPNTSNEATFNDSTPSTAANESSNSTTTVISVSDNSIEILYDSDNQQMEVDTTPPVNDATIDLSDSLEDRATKVERRGEEEKTDDEEEGDKEDRR